MIDFKEKLKENLSKKNMTQLSIWYMAQSTIQKFFDWKFKVNIKMKNNIIFVRPFPKYIWSEIYKHKEKIIQDLNSNIQNFNINKEIKDIIIK